MLPRSSPISLSEYRSFLNRLWPDPIKRLGLAISGGVDSMALAYLTHKLINEKQHTDSKHSVPSVHAFIIDHGARPSSSSEAFTVAEILRGYGFTTDILPLLWKPGDLSVIGFETRARTARYRTLAKACLRNGILRLLLAHHADDQAETVMMRLISGSRLDGLGGMKAVAGIPECWDVFGAKQVVVGRPFLEVGKERLKATCEHSSVTWFEDSTNYDATYTRRNAVRQLLNADPPRLPRALQRTSLVAISKRAETRNHTVKAEALQLLHNCEIALNTRTGTLKLKLPCDHAALWKDVKEAVLMRMLIEVAEMTSPSHRVETRHMLTAFEKVFSAREGDEVKTFTSAGLTWTYEGKHKWTLNREPFYAQKREQVTEFEAGQGWSDWKLWDRRWWIRVQTPVGMKSTFMRALRDEDMKLVRHTATKQKTKRQLNSILKELKMGLRFTVPVVFWRGYDESGETEDTDVLVALPTVGFNFVDGARYEVQFKDYTVRGAPPGCIYSEFSKQDQTA